MVGDLSATDVSSALLAFTEKAKIGLVVRARGEARVGPVFLSDAAVDIFGHPREVLMQRDLLELVAEEERGRAHALVDRIARGEAAGPFFQSVIVRADGRRVPLDVTFVHVTHRGRALTLSFVVDRGEGKAAETEGCAHELEALRKLLVEGHLDPASREEARARLEDVAAGTNRVAAIARALCARPRPARPRVLIVDDEPAIGRSLRALLEGAYHIEVVTTGEEALRRLFGEETFDAVLCDLTLGDLSGMEVYDRLAKARPGRERHIVFMTGGATTAEAEDFLARVPNESLEKPFELKDLDLALRAAFLC